MNSRHMGTKFGRLFFLRPLWKLPKEQTSAYYGSFTSSRYLWRPGQVSLQFTRQDLLFSHNSVL